VVSLHHTKWLPLFKNCAISRNNCVSNPMNSGL
jgi:hypothetical protein